MSSSNKAVEIYNGSGESITLLGYSLALYSNGATDITQSYDLSGVTLGAGEVFVLANSAAGTEILAVADDDQAYPSVPNWNGNDVVALLFDGAIVDAVGVLGDDSNFAKDVTLVRNADVTSSNATYTVSEWTSYAQDTFDYIGSHSVVA